MHNQRDAAHSFTLLTVLGVIAAVMAGSTAVHWTVVKFREVATLAKPSWARVTPRFFPRKFKRVRCLQK